MKRMSTITATTTAKTLTTKIGQIVNEVLPLRPKSISTNSFHNDNETDPYIQIYRICMHTK